MLSGLALPPPSTGAGEQWSLLHALAVVKAEVSECRAIVTDVRRLMERRRALEAKTHGPLLPCAAGADGFPPPLCEVPRAVAR